MFIDRLDGNWLQHPFWKSSFKLDKPKQLKTLQESAVSHVWIDTDKGLDVANEAVNSTASEAPPSTSPAEKTPITSTQSVPIEEEMSAARETLEKARQATMAVLQEARMGNSVSSADVAPLVEEISASIERNASAMLTVSRMKTKDDYTYLHSVAVCALMIALGKQLNYQAACTHWGWPAYCTMWARCRFPMKYSTSRAGSPTRNSRWYWNIRARAGNY